MSDSPKSTDEVNRLRAEFMRRKALRPHVFAERWSADEYERDSFCPLCKQDIMFLVADAEEPAEPVVWTCPHCDGQTSQYVGGPLLKVVRRPL
jgi:hypothetical protein